MSAPRTVSIVGARPQFIKAAVVSRALRGRDPSPFVDQLVHTGQHFDWGMSEVFFDELDIPRPAENLEVGPGSHGAVTGAMIPRIEDELVNRGADAVIVYGDTNTTLAGALAASKLGVPVVHVEAGLRSYNRRMPEEINRVLTDHVSSVLLCPSSVSRDNLQREGITDGVRVVGDTLYDAVLHYRKRAAGSGRRYAYAVATVHRAENTDDAGRLEEILSGLVACELPVVLPLHPRTKKALERYGLQPPSNVEAVEPVSYLAMIGLMRDSSFVLTDSGGLQKEAYFLGKACVTLREETEWTELVDLGVNRLTGADSRAIKDACRWAGEAPVPSTTPYGCGTAGEAIVDVLEEGLAAWARN